MRKLQIAVIGDNNPSADTMRWAEEIGRLLAQNDAVVVCGGLGGAMAAVARGAAAAGGITVGTRLGRLRSQRAWNEIKPGTH